MRASMLAPIPDRAVLPMPGLEPDNLLAMLATLGLLRALDTARPAWLARISWVGAPWEARLHLAEAVGEEEVAVAADEGVHEVAARFDVGERKNVDFDREAFRAFVQRQGAEEVGQRMAAALSAEWPEKRAGGLRAASLVMMFGQGHQNFLERLAAVPRSDASGVRSAAGPEGRASIRAALFAPWARRDQTNAFRWDPEEDQRYALRFGNPSKAGAARTVHGANRLAAIGILSCVCAPGSRRLAASGWSGEAFVWPIWTSPLRLRAIEALLTHPEVLARGPRGTGPSGARLRALGIGEIFSAARISNGKYMNVVRARPASAADAPREAAAPFSGPKR